MTRLVRRPWDRLRLQEHFTEESLCETSHAPTCDINNIVARHARAGGLPPPRNPPQYGDVTALQGPLRDRIEFAQTVLSSADAFLSARAAEPPPTQVPTEAA